MIPQYFLYLILPLSILSFGTSLVAVINKKVKPNLASYYVWLLANATAVIGAILKGYSILDVFNVFMVVIGLLVVVLTSLLTKYYYVESSRFDKICLVLGVLGILVLLLIPEKNWAIGLAIIVDFVGCLPTYFKIWFSKTESENLWGFLLSFIAITINILTISSFTFANSGFLLFTFCSTLGFVISIINKDFKLGKYNFNIKKYNEK
jgi:hypothetical protein